MTVQEVSTLDLLELTLGEFDEVEEQLGHSILPNDLSASAMLALVTKLLERDLDPAGAFLAARNVRAKEVIERFTRSTDRLPTYYENGVPHNGRTADAYIVACARRFNWPPDVTRRQTLHDLRVVFEAIEGEGNND